MPQKSGAGSAAEPRAFVGQGVYYFESKTLKAGGELVARAAIVTEVLDQQALMLHVFRPTGVNIDTRSTWSKEPAFGCWQFIPASEAGG